MFHFPGQALALLPIGGALLPGLCRAQPNLTAADVDHFVLLQALLHASGLRGVPAIAVETAIEAPKLRMAVCAIRTAGSDGPRRGGESLRDVRIGHWHDQGPVAGPWGRHLNQGDRVQPPQERGELVSGMRGAHPSFRFAGHLLHAGRENGHRLPWRRRWLIVALQLALPVAVVALTAGNQHQHRTRAGAGTAPGILAEGGHRTLGEA